jgi:hypothetical protein
MPRGTSTPFPGCSLPHGPCRHPAHCARRRPARDLQLRPPGSVTCSSARPGFATSSSTPPTLALGARDLSSPDYSARRTPAPPAPLHRCRRRPPDSCASSSTTPLPSSSPLPGASCRWRQGQGQIGDGIQCVKTGGARFLTPGRTNDSRERKKRPSFGTDSAPAGHGAGAESVPNTPSSANWREPIMCGAVVPMNQFPVTVL